MRADGVVVALPGFDENLGFFEGVEDVSIQELVAQPRSGTSNVLSAKPQTACDTLLSDGQLARNEMMI